MAARSVIAQRSPRTTQKRRDQGKNGSIRVTHFCAKRLSGGLLLLALPQCRAAPRSPALLPIFFRRTSRAQAVFEPLHQPFEGDHY